MANLDFIRFCFPFVDGPPVCLGTEFFFGQLVVGELVKAAAGCVCNASLLCGDGGNMRDDHRVVPFVHPS